MRKFFYDPHVHTREVSPCSKVFAEKLVKHYKKAGYSGIVITDHFSEYGLKNLKGGSWEEKIKSYLKGYKTAKKQGRKIGITVFWGIELCFDGPIKNDFLIYGLTEEFLRQNKNLHKSNLNAFCKLTQGLDILIYQAHPFRSGMIHAPRELIQGVEVFNGNSSHEPNNHLALEYAEKHDLLKISGSDTHHINEIGKGGIYLPEKAETIHDFIRMLKENPDIEFKTDHV